MKLFVSCVMVEALLFSFMVPLVARGGRLGLVGFPSAFEEERGVDNADVVVGRTSTLVRSTISRPINLQIEKQTKLTAIENVRKS